jgi:hypothetical protein
MATVYLAQDVRHSRRVAVKVLHPELAATLGPDRFLREIKTLLGMDVLRCKSPQMVLKEVLMHQIAYNMVRALMQEAALRYHLDLSRLSFKATLDSIAHFQCYPPRWQASQTESSSGHSH